MTPRPQAGNPRPRVFRLPKDNAIINRIGLANRGLEATIRHLRRPHDGVIVGCNIGKNTSTPAENAPADYLKLFRSLYQYADYFTVNISCDNACREGTTHTREHILQILNPLFDFRRGQNQFRPISTRAVRRSKRSATDVSAAHRSHTAPWRSCAASTPVRAEPTPSSGSAD